MWSKWDEKQVDLDFKALTQSGATVLRIFPLWPDFQPITRLYLGDGTPTGEFRFGENPLPDTDAGRAGVSEVMMQRFERLADLAARHRIELIVALLTGQMTYRLYMPPGLAGLSPLTHPVALMWERRFVQYFVSRMKHHSAIVAWDFGNECDMWQTPSREDAWCWMAYISDAIRLCDDSHPIVSGMLARHLDDSVFSKETWPVQSQAEHCDILTSHSYMQWGFVGSDPCDTIKQTLAPTVEVRLATDISGKPAFMEEMGLAWRPMIANDERFAAYMRNNLWNLWADDCRGLLWWCGFDQSHLTIAPYNWETPGPEHGIMDQNRKALGGGRELGRFRRFLDKLPFKSLSPLKRKAVCILGDHRQSQGMVATGAYILAKQAGFDLEFQQASKPLKQAALYLIPSAKGKGGLPVERLDALKKAVREGASLYLSSDDVYLPGLSDLFSAEVETRCGESVRATLEFQLDNDALKLDLPLGFSYRMKAKGAGTSVIGSFTDGGSPVFFKARYGRGTVWLLGLPLEAIMAKTPGAFLNEESGGAWKIYAHIARDILAERIVKKPVAQPHLSVTEHYLSGSRLACVVVNNMPGKLTAKLDIQAGWHLKHCFSYDASAKTEDGSVLLNINGNSGTVLLFTHLL
ncbi:hypothetical protein OPIT5_23385 [Opitutaceae bacterium TAV5]|nr:hypothetical protein OPIT5_23385 [Opitutaceae bacterium TAV5]